jgi:hypothetical protein
VAFGQTFIRDPQAGQTLGQFRAMIEEANRQASGFAPTLAGALLEGAA